MLTRGIVLALTAALAFGCTEQQDETQEIVDNLLQAGFPANNIIVVGDVVHVGQDTEVSLVASREMLHAGDSSEEQYRTTNTVNTLLTNPPNPVTIEPQYCQGFHYMSWTAQPGATYYQLYRSLAVSFISPVMLYSGPNTARMVNVSNNATWYLRAKACNATGCSGYSTQVSATYWSGVCL